MRFTILTENRESNCNCINEDGLSIYIELENKKILLDAGITDAFMKNAKVLGIDLQEIDKIVLSHGHWDHGNGLKYINLKKTLILHPDAYTKRYSLLRNMAFGGINQTREELKEKFDLIETKEPYQIFENVWFLGQINRRFEVPKENAHTVLENNEKDYLYDDTGIVVKLEKGIVVFSSCSHSGINNIIEQAKEVTRDDRILAVVGGFHLKKLNEYTNKIIEYFSSNNIKVAYMGHCTSDEVIQEFKNKLKSTTKVTTLYAGAKFEI